MANNHVIPITNGIGTKEITNGNYNVTAEFEGYDNSSIKPESIEIKDGEMEYNFTVAATGTLTLHVSDDGSEIGVQIVGATFQRCDSSGKGYGNVITSDSDGNAIFEHVPFLSTGTPPIIYYKQLSSDGEHEFNSDLQNVSMSSQTLTVEVENAASIERTFKITDENYQDLPIEDGSITLIE